jgi:cytochrome P450
MSDASEAGAGTGGPLDAMGPELATNPQPVFRLLRESTPVLRVDGVGLVVSGRVEIDEALRHPEIYSSNMDAVDLKNVRPLIPLQIDPPHHKKYRKILDPLFAPRQVAVLEPSVTELANGLIDGFVDAGTCDFATEFSVPFPSQVFLTLLGLPLDDLPLFLEMKDGIIRPAHVTGLDVGSDETQAYQTKIAQSIYTYFDDVLDQRQVEPRDDLLSRFLDTEVEGEQLTREEILDVCFLFLIAGLDTVTATLDCMFGYLAQHPEQQRQIADDATVIPAVIEELLRWETPVMGIARVAVEDGELGGCPVHKGDPVMALLGSANTDDVEFGDGDTVRFDRDSNKHLAFGGGIHRCLGSHLARLELRVALTEWHRRIEQYSVAQGHELTYTPGIRSTETFPMVFVSRSHAARAAR